MQGNQTSTIAHLRTHIEQEHQAACWALTGLHTGTAQHAFIQRRMNHIQISVLGLEQITGTQEATAILCSIFESTPKGREREHTLSRSESTNPSQGSILSASLAPRSSLQRHPGRTATFASSSQDA